MEAGARHELLQAAQVAAVVAVLEEEELVAGAKAEGGEVSVAGMQEAWAAVARQREAESLEAVGWEVTPWVEMVRVEAAGATVASVRAVMARARTVAVMVAVAAASEEVGSIQASHLGS